jgi:hypothetical protein
MFEKTLSFGETNLKIDQKKMTSEQAYINGFVKRAAAHGFSEAEAVNILKLANTRSRTPAQDPMVIPPTPGAPAHIPAYTPKYNSSTKVDPISPEINKQLTSIPLSGMTPKNRWEQGLHDIMAKKPVFNTDGDVGGYSTGLAPTPVDMANDHIDTLQRAANATRHPTMYPEINSPGYNKSTTAPTILGSVKSFFSPPQNIRNKSPASYNPGTEQGYVTPAKPLWQPKNPGGFEYDPVGVRNNHISEISQHLNKYDPSWGSSFRIPVQRHDDAMHNEDIRARFRGEELDRNKKQFNNSWGEHVNEQNGAMDGVQIKPTNY